MAAVWLHRLRGCYILWPTSQPKLTWHTQPTGSPVSVNSRRRDTSSIVRYIPPGIARLPLVLSSRSLLLLVVGRFIHSPDCRKQSMDARDSELDVTTGGGMTNREWTDSIRSTYARWTMSSKQFVFTNMSLATTNSWSRVGM